MKILLGMSGGIDSTYAAVKLKSEGHTVEGAVLVMHEYTELDAARQAAESVGIPLHEIDCRKRFDEIVKRNFIEEYKNARTPNPCIICNSEIKFGYLLEYAEDNGFDAIATGHYGRVLSIDTDEGVRYALSFASDSGKDQSYVLWRLSQKVLSKLVLPLSDMSKSLVRESSRSLGLFAADRPDSQEICFIPSGDHAAFIEREDGASLSGNFVDEEGRIISEHKGIAHYTVGQRRGLGISAASRLFVKSIDAKTGDITVTPIDPTATRVKLSGVVYSGMPEARTPVKLRLSAKLRYAARPVPATVTFNMDEASVELDAPHRAVTPGQSCVLYDGDILVAGGFIDCAE